MSVPCSERGVAVSRCGIARSRRDILSDELQRSIQQSIYIYYY